MSSFSSISSSSTAIMMSISIRDNTTPCCTSLRGEAFEILVPEEPDGEVGLTSEGQGGLAGETDEARPLDEALMVLLLLRYWGCSHHSTGCRWAISDLALIV